MMNALVACSDKLQEIEKELLAKPDTVLGRILMAKENEIGAKNKKIEEAESVLSQRNDDITTLTEQVTADAALLFEAPFEIDLRVWCRHSRRCVTRIPRGNL